MNPTRSAVAAFLLLLSATTLGIAGGAKVIYDATSVLWRDVVVATGKGPKLVNLTEALDGSSFLLSLDPRGRTVALLNQIDPFGDQADLYLARLNGKKLVRATAGLAGRPHVTAWSGRGKLLLFEHRDSGTDRSDLYLIDARGRRRQVTGALPGTASPPGSSTVLRYGHRRDAAFLWHAPDAVRLYRGDPADPAGLLDVTGDLPEGEPGAAFELLPDGRLLFPWLPAGEDLPSLYFQDEGGPERLLENMAGWTTAGPSWAAVVRDAAEETFVVCRPDARTEFDLGGRVERFALGGNGYAAAAVRDGASGELRLLLLTNGPPVDLLPSVELQAVVDLRLMGESGRVAALVTVDGARRLFVTDPGGAAAVEPAAGLPGAPGQVLASAPDGDLLVFTQLAGDEKLLAWSPGEANPRDLAEGAGIEGAPGTASFSPRRGDLLFTLLEGPDRIARLVRWERRKNVFRPLSPRGFRVGRFFAVK